MVDDRQLSAPLEQLESDLLARSLPKPPPGLRSRTLAATRVELRADARRSWSSFAAMTAAAAVLCINLSLSALWATGPSRRVVAGRRSLAVTAWQVRELLPELSEAQSRRQAFVQHDAPRPARSPGLSPDTSVDARRKAIESLLY